MEGNVSNRSVETDSATIGPCVAKWRRLRIYIYIYIRNNEKQIEMGYNLKKEKCDISIQLFVIFNGYLSHEKYIFTIKKLCHWTKKY